LNLAGTGIIYLGTGGLVGNPGAGGSGYFVNLSGGTMAAKDDWSSAASLTLSGTVTFQTADAAGTPRDIALAGILSGSGAAINKTGGGKLTLSATNTYSGATTISAGTLALAATGFINNSPTITVAAGAVYDVSAGGGTNLLAAQTLAGKGAVAGNLNVLLGGTGAHIQPGGNGSSGTLTFSNDLSEAGNVINNFDLSNDPTGTVKTNDFLLVLGNLTFNGTNTIQVNPLDGSIPANSTYKLIQYGGSLTGALQTNLVVAGVTGTLSNDVPAKTIWLVIPNPTRPPTNVVWLGSALSSAWDTQVSSNWFNVGAAARDVFVTGDSVRFDDTGATNPVVALSGSVSPSITLVDSVSNYTFTGSGTLDGAGGLDKTNSGVLSLQTLNNGYSGGTVVGGGTLEVAKLANGGLTCSLGSSSSDPTNLVVFSSTLRYLGGNVTTDRGVTLNDAGVTVEVTNPAAALTLSGTLTGPGALVKTGPGTLTLSGAGSYGGGTVISNGALRLNNATAASGGLTNQGATLRIGTTTTITNNVEFDGACIIDLLNQGGNQALDGAWAGSGTVTFINQDPNARTFTIGGRGSMNAFTGTLAMTTNTGFFRLNDGGATGSGPNFGNALATFDLGTGSATLLQRNGGTVNYLGALIGGPNTKLAGNTVNAGNVTYVLGGKGTDTLFQGLITDGISPTGILKDGAGTLTLSGTNTYTGGTTISNGVLALTGAGSITPSSFITVMTNTVLDVAGRTNGTLTLRSGQNLIGEGTVRGSVEVPSGASLSPGPVVGAIGRMTITNALVLRGGSTLNMTLDYYQFLGGATNNQIDGLARVTYGGTLNLGINSIETNSVFKLFSAGTYSGAFAAISPAVPPLAGSWVWDTNSLAVDGTLRVAPLRPLVQSLEWTGTELILRGTNGTPYATYYVLTSTNVSLPASQWTPIATNQFDYDGTFSATNAVTPGVPQEFYLLQLP
jgi:autotransporter-associated beta strand protein